jgi:hypothetical protein
MSPSDTLPLLLLLLPVPGTQVALDENSTVAMGVVELTAADG